MEEVACEIKGYSVTFDQAREMARIMAERGNDYATLVSWYDKEKEIHSPCCLKCEMNGEPAWEVYGRNHEGRLRVSFGGDNFVFIYS